MIPDDNIELEIEHLSSDDYNKWVQKDIDFDDNGTKAVLEISLIFF